MEDTATRADAPGATNAAPTGAARIAFSVSIRPLSSVLGDVAGLLGESLLGLLGMFYPPAVGKKANVVVTELVTNVMENVTDPASGFDLSLALENDVLHIAVTNTVTEEQFGKVQARIAQVGNAVDAKKLLAQTIRERRPQRLKGGLGLMRLVAENRFALRAEYNQGRMTVHAEYPLKGSA